MNANLVCAALSAGMSLLAARPAASAPVNPLYRMFPNDIRLLLSFDDGTIQPDVGAVSPGKGRPAVETSEGGVIGRCLSAGRVAFPPEDMFGKPLVDFDGPGTVICWVRYVEGVPKGKNPGITFFSAHFKPTEKCPSKRLIMMKQGGASCMNAFYEYFTDKRHWATAITPCDYGKWPLGEWRMCVMTWTAEKIGFSKNGEPLVEEAYGDRFGELSGFAVSAPAINDPGRFYQIDEFAVLGRKLTDAEIRTVYAAFGQRQVRQESIGNDKEAR